MSTPVHIVGRERVALVTDAGQLVVAPIAYDLTQFLELSAADTAFNFFKPKPGHRFIITLMRGKAPQSVNPTTDATVVIYQADAEDATTAERVLHQESLVRGESFTLPVNLSVDRGKFVNGKTDDATIPMTIMGYYVPDVS